MVNKILDVYENPFDVILLKFIDTHLDVYNNSCITPNMVTTLALLSGIMSAFSLYNKQFILSGILWLLSYYFDCVDGKLARKFNKVTKFGDYYDHLSDTFKSILLLYTFYITNNDYFKKIIIIVVVLIILCLIHMGYQEKIYDSDESPTLKCIHKCLLKGDPKEMIKYTKYVGCGTYNLVIFLFIIYQAFV
jgi:hypothetical protein